MYTENEVTELDYLMVHRELKQKYFDEDKDLHLWDEFNKCLEDLTKKSDDEIKSPILRQIKNLYLKDELQCKLHYYDSSLQFIQVRDNFGMTLMNFISSYYSNNYITFKLKDLMEFHDLPVS